MAIVATILHLTEPCEADQAHELRSVQYLCFPRGTEMERNEDGANDSMGVFPYKILCKSNTQGEVQINGATPTVME